MKEEAEYYQDGAVCFPFSLPANPPLVPSYEIDEGFVPTWAQPVVAPNPPFAPLVAPPSPSPMAQRLLLLSDLVKQGKITLDQKRDLKDLLLQGDELINSTFEAFHVDNDLDELLDSLQMLQQYQKAALDLTR